MYKYAIDSKQCILITSRLNARKNSEDGHILRGDRNMFYSFEQRRTDCAKNAKKIVTTSSLRAKDKVVDSTTILMETASNVSQIPQFADGHQDMKYFEL